MSDLSEESKALLKSGRDLFHPSAEDRARITSALAARLPADAFEPGAAGPTRLARHGSVWKFSALAVGVGVAAVSLFFTLRKPAPEAPRALPAPVPVLSAPAAPAISQDERAPRELELAPGPREPEERKKAPSSTPAPRDSLAEEVALLSRATAALRAGQPLEALKLLDEHQRRFPNGRLAEERLGARIPALCALHRRTEAEAALTRLSRMAPRSPHLARARTACGF